VVLLPEKWRLRLEILIHGFVILFGAIMAKSGWLWTTLKWSDIKPMLGVPVEVLRAFLGAMPGLLIVVIILAGILSGIFTATESAATAVFWALLVTALVYKTLSWGDFLKACAKACKATGVVLLLIGISSAFGYFMALYEVPQKTGELMQSVTDNPLVIFLMINLLLFILGTFLDMAATILVCTPIFLPIAMHFGMDPVQFGIVMLINCALGLNTPPVGVTR
jgi:tripartite ATP-independent transporter DctM subunit